MDNAATASRSNFRWVIMLLIMLVIIINYVDRSSIAYAIGPISKLFKLDAAQSGLILGAFGVGYVLTTFLGGIAADRLGARRVLFFSTFLWTFAIGWTGVATSFLMIYLARISLGLAEGPGFPSLTRVVSDWLPRRERARALSLGLVAVPVSLAIGAPLVSELIIRFGWRWMFIVLSILSLCWLPLWWFLFRDQPSQSRWVNTAELEYIQATGDEPPSQRRKIKGMWKFLVSNPTLLANNWAFFVFGYFLFFFMTWLPTYLKDSYHFDLHQVGLFSILPWAFAAVMLWGVGHLSDWVYERTGNFRLARSYPIWISQLLAAVSVIPIILTHDVHIALIFISLAVGFGLSANSAFYAANIDIARERAGTALGIMDLCFAIAGFVAPVITGVVVEYTGHFTDAFWLLAILALSSVLIVIMFHHPESSKKLDNL